MTPDEELRALLDQELMPAHWARWGRSQEWGAQLGFQRALAAHGWVAPGWPVELGGRGLDTAQQVACGIALHEAGAPSQPAVFGVSNVGPTIMAWGTAEQRKHLRGIVRVDELWCQGFSEPDSGSDLAGLRTRAELDGDTFVINGQKVWTSIGMHATHCMVLARSDPDAPKHKGISALLVPLDTPGVSRRAIRQMNGASEFAELFFDDVRVPSTALLGPLHEGWKVTMTTLGHERAGLLALCGMLTSDASRITRELSREGRLSAMNRDVAIRLYIQAQLVQRTGERALAAESGAPGALSTIIKLAFADVAQRLHTFAVDAAGMPAVAGGPDLPRAERLAFSRCLTIAGGTTEVLKNLIGERVLGLPKEPA